MWEAQDSIDKNALPPQTTLQSKVPRDSAVRVQYAFTADGELRDRYTNCWGAMDKGIIFEDLDALAGNVAWRHAIMGNGTDVRPPILVTAAVDEVRLRGSLKPDSDIYMTGRVIFVGSSSMLVRCEVGHTSGGTPEGAAVDDSSTMGSCDESLAVRGLPVRGARRRDGQGLQSEPPGGVRECGGGRPRPGARGKAGGGRGPSARGRWTRRRGWRWTRP